MLGRIAFHLIRPLLYAVSYLPFWVLYRLSDVLFVILYYVVGYRKRVVAENLEHAFPELSPFARKGLLKTHYRYLCDLILEALKTLTISQAAATARVEIVHTELFDKYYAEGRSVVLVTGHLGNWELIGAAYAGIAAHTLYIIYHPLKDPNWESLTRHMRTRLGNGLYRMREASRDMLAHMDDPRITAFIADQAAHPDRGYWMEFMGREAPVFLGTARLARRLNQPIIYASISRPRRGHYRVELELLYDQPQNHTEEEITMVHTKRLEQDIRRQPDIYLWTHRRWKHRRS